MEDRNAMPTEAMVEAACKERYVRWELLPEAEKNQARLKMRRWIAAALAHSGQVREIAITPEMREAADRARNEWLSRDENDQIGALNAALDAALALQEREPIIYVSSKQLPPDPAHGYIPCRLKPEGNFDTALYALSPSPSIPEEKGGTVEIVHGPYTTPEELANALDIPVEALTKPTAKKGE